VADGQRLVTAGVAISQAVSEAELSEY